MAEAPRASTKYSCVASLQHLTAIEFVKLLENRNYSNLATILHCVNAKQLQIVLGIAEVFAEKAKIGDPSSSSFSVIGKVTQASLDEPNWSSRENLFTLTQFLCHVYLLTFSQVSRPIRASDLVQILCRLYEIGNLVEKRFAQNAALKWSLDPTFGSAIFQRQPFKKLIASSLDLSPSSADYPSSEIHTTLELYCSGNRAITHRLLNCKTFASEYAAELVSGKLEPSLDVLVDILHRHIRPRRASGIQDKCRTNLIERSMVAAFTTFNAINRFSQYRDTVSTGIVARIFNAALPLLRSYSNQPRQEEYRMAALYCLKTWAIHEGFGRDLITHHLQKLLTALFSQPYSTDSPAWHVAILVTGNAYSRTESEYNCPEYPVTTEEQITILYAFVVGFAQLDPNMSLSLIKTLTKRPRNSIGQESRLQNLVRLARRLSPSFRAFRDRQEFPADDTITMWAQFVWSALSCLFAHMVHSLRDINQKFDFMFDSAFNLTVIEEGAEIPRIYFGKINYLRSPLKEEVEKEKVEEKEDNCFIKAIVNCTEQSRIVRIELRPTRDPTEATVLRFFNLEPVRLLVDTAVLERASPFLEAAASERWSTATEVGTSGLGSAKIMRFHRQHALPFLTVLHIIHGCTLWDCEFLRRLPAKIFDVAGTQGHYDYAARLLSLTDFLCLSSFQPLEDYLLASICYLYNNENPRAYQSLLCACLRSTAFSRYPRFHVQLICESLRHIQSPADSCAPRDFLSGCTFAQCLRVVLRHGEEGDAGLLQITKLLHALLEIYSKILGSRRL